MNGTSNPDLKARQWVCPECGHRDDDYGRGMLAYTNDVCCRRDEPTVLTADGLHVPPGGFKRVRASS